MLMIKVNCPFLHSSMKKNSQIHVENNYENQNFAIIFWPSIPNQTKYLEPFYGSFHRPSIGFVYSPLNSATLSCSSKVTLHHLAAFGQSNRKVHALKRELCWD